MSRIATKAVRGGREDLKTLGVHALPIDLSTTYPFHSLEEATESLDAFVEGAGEASNPVYARLHNPTVARFEKALAALEKAETAVAFASGMATLSAVLLALPTETRHVVAVRPIYGTTDHLLTDGLLGTSVTWAQSSRVQEAIQPNTGLVVIETPGNPLLNLIGIQSVVEQAGDVPVLVDSTFASPILQKPLEHGATLVLHSATKFLGGHGDVVGGAVACSGDWARRIRQIRLMTGGLMHPLAAYLLHRGLQTLPIRVAEAQKNAIELASRLCGHKAVERVYYPLFEECDPQILVGRQMDGPGSMISFEVGDYAAAALILSTVELATPAVSLGSVDTLIQHPAGLTHRVVDEQARYESGVGEGLIRLSVGLEDVEDIWEDLDRALHLLDTAVTVSTTPLETE